MNMHVLNESANGANDAERIVAGAPSDHRLYLLPYLLLMGYLKKPNGKSGHALRTLSKDAEK